MAGKKNYSAILAKHYNTYQKNPRSRVFAPLAESFRKLGMLEEAFKILKEGIRFHPDYVLGYVVLAHCYFDQQKYELTYNTLRPIINRNADNISLQRLFGEACIQLGYLEEALDTFKYLLFMNPKDKIFAGQVKKLEDDLQVGHKKLSLDQLIKAPDLSFSPPKTETLEDDWVQVNFVTNKGTEEKNDIENIGDEKKNDFLENQWVMKFGKVEEKIEITEDKIFNKDLEDDYFADEFASDDVIEEHPQVAFPTDSPIISHTLIDLYCSQHYYDKAIELLEKILVLNPDDLRTKEKLKKVKEQMVTAFSSSGSALSGEQEGHEELISIIEEQVKNNRSTSDSNPRSDLRYLKVENVLNKFLILIKKKANHKTLNQ